MDLKFGVRNHTRYSLQPWLISEVLAKAFLATQRSWNDADDKETYLVLPSQQCNQCGKFCFSKILYNKCIKLGMEIILAYISS